jgi:hypothetical protein
MHTQLLPNVVHGQSLCNAIQIFGVPPGSRLQVAGGDRISNYLQIRVRARTTKHTSRCSYHVLVPHSQVCNTNPRRERANVAAHTHGAHFHHTHTQRVSPSQIHLYDITWITLTNIRMYKSKPNVAQSATVVRAPASEQVGPHKSE